MQKNDRRLKLLNASQCLVYALHFVMLGNPAASASSLVSGMRSLMALRTRSVWAALLMFIACLVVGSVLAKTAVGWLPVVASCIATVAVFLMHGISMRLALLTSTLLWLANNLYSGSIGGSVLETTVVVVNVSTILRLRKEAAAAAL